MATQDKNQVTFGLENVHWAEVTLVADNGTLSYGAPKRLPGAVELTLDTAGDSGIFKADNINYYVAESNDGYTGKLKIAKLTDEFSQAVLGELIDETSKVVTETANAKKKYFALMFQIEGDKKATRHILYYCFAQRPSFGSSTKDGTNVNTTELSFSASPRPLDKVVKRKTSEETPDQIYNEWFTKPFEPGSVGS